MLKWSNTEKAFFFGAAVLLAASTYFIMRGLGSGTVPSIESNQKAVGSVRRHAGDVRRKHDADIQYSAVSLDMPVFNHDAVFTGENSMAEIALSSGADINVSERSIVVISTNDENENTLALKLGSFLAKLKPSEHLRLGGKGGKIRVQAKDTVARFDKTGDGTRITVLKGDLELVEADGQKKIIRENQVVALADSGEAGEVLTYPLELETPAVGSMLWLNRGEQVRLSWAGASNDRGFEVVVARDAELKSVLVKKTVSAREFEIEPERGATHFWRVKSLSGDRSESLIGTFTVFENSPPKLSLPADHAVFESRLADDGRAAAPVDFRWVDSTMLEKFDIEVARDREFASVAVRSESRSHDFSVPSLPEGTYYWRVRGSHPSQTAPQWSEVREFSIRAPSVNESAHVALASLASDEMQDEPQTPLSEGHQDALERHPAQTNATPPPPPPPAEAPVALDPAPQPVAATPSPSPSPSPVSHSRKEDYWIWAGLGGNFLKYAQSLPGYKDISFGNLKAPGLSLRGGSMLTDSFGLDFTYKESLGEVKSSDTVTVRNGSFKWRHVSAEALVKLGDGLWGLSQKDDLYLQAGVQYHIVPFLVPINATVRDTRENYMMLATLGARYRIWRHERLRYEVMLRYQYPFESGSTGGDRMSIQPQFAFDGSIGQVYQFTDTVYLGLYWYGQWHKYRFDFSSDSPSRSMSGEQELFYSNVDLRLGLEF